MMAAAGAGTVASKTISAWVDISAFSNTAVGVKGSSYEIQVHLGDESLVFPAGKPASGITIIAKASHYRIVNTGKHQLEFIGFA